MPAGGRAVLSLGLTDSCHGALAVDAAHFARGYKKAERLRLRLCSRGKRRRRSRRGAVDALDDRRAAKAGEGTLNDSV